MRIATYIHMLKDLIVVSIGPHDIPCFFSISTSIYPTIEMYKCSFQRIGNFIVDAIDFSSPLGLTLMHLPTKLDLNIIYEITILPRVKTHYCHLMLNSSYISCNEHILFLQIHLPKLNRVMSNCCTTS